MIDLKKELDLFLDYYVSDQSQDIRDAVELDKHFHVINVPKLLAVNGLAESYVFRLKDAWGAWLKRATIEHEKDKRISQLTDLVRFLCQSCDDACDHPLIRKTNVERRLDTIGKQNITDENNIFAAARWLSGEEPK